MKGVTWLGSSKQDLMSFPATVRQAAGFQLHLVQHGDEPSDWKPMSSIGAGVREIRMRDETGAFRVIYVASISDTVYVLHAFQKKSQKTAKKDLELARERFRQIRR